MLQIGGMPLGAVSRSVSMLTRMGLSRMANCATIAASEATLPTIESTLPIVYS